MPLKHSAISVAPLTNRWLTRVSKFSKPLCPRLQHEEMEGKVRLLPAAGCEQTPSEIAASVTAFFTNLTEF